MSKLLVSWYNRSSCKECSHQLERDFTNTVFYLWIGYFIYPTLDPSPIWCWISNLLFIFVSWQVFKFTCDKCIWQCKRDLIKITFFMALGHFVFPYVEHWQGLWWIFHAIYMYCMGDIFYLVVHQKSPFIPAFVLIAWKLRQGLSNEAPSDFHAWAQESGHKTSLCHHHAEGLFARGKDVFLAREKCRKDEGEKNKLVQIKEKNQDGPLKDTVHENCTKKELKRKDVFESSLNELTEKVEKWEEMFEDWSSSKTREMAKFTSEETNLKEKIVLFCQQRQKIREDMVKHEFESKELAKKIVESETSRTKLVKKRQRIQARMEERLYELKTEKAKLLEAIQRIKVEMSKDSEDVATENESVKKIEPPDLKMETTNELMKEIEVKERDLECPVCFELCTKPIYMCNFSHQICKSCRPKMTLCPQCREPYKKNKIRNKEKEQTSNNLKQLYRKMKVHLEAA